MELIPIITKYVFLTLGILTALGIIFNLCLVSAYYKNQKKIKSLKQKQQLNK